MASVVVNEELNLDRYQSVFRWARAPQLASCDHQSVLASVKDKLITADCEWRAIVYRLVASFESYRLGLLDAALEHLLECENIIQAAECFQKGSLIFRQLEPVKHVVYSAWAHWKLASQPRDEIKDYLSCITMYKDLSPEQKSGVKGIHAACLLLYGKEGCNLSIECVQTALKSDPAEVEWNYLLAEALRLKRCSSIDPEKSPSKIELRLLEMAHNQDQTSPAYHLALAMALHASVRKDKEQCATRDKATSLYKTALLKWPDSAYVQLMCASGLMDYTYSFRDTKLADKCLGNALKLAPNSCHVHMVAAAFFNWPCKNPDAAKGHMTKAKARYKDLVRSIEMGDILNYRVVLALALF